MEIKAKHVYQKSVDSVFRSFGDKAGIGNKFKAVGHRSVQFETCRLTKSTLELALHREVPVNAPALLKRFLGEWNQVSQKEKWQGTPGKSYVGDINIHIKGVPVSIAGKMVLTGDSRSCTNDVVLTIQCSIPLIGKKLAEFIGETSASELEKEYDYIRANI